jgi:hypothetical protein
MLKSKYIILVLQIVVLLSISGCDNPFAPRLVKNSNDQGSISDQKTIDGVFHNFRMAYKYKDTLIYGGLLASNFMFVYRNYDKGMDVSWGRSEDMLTTYGLFQAAQSLDLYWNDIVMEIGDSVKKDISRSFTMNIVFSASDIIPVQGRANLRLEREDTLNPWRITIWRDESNY